MSRFKGSWLPWILALVFALGAGGAALQIFGQAADKSEYYVFNQNVAAHTKITTDVVGKIETNASGIPPTALSLDKIVNGDLWTTIPQKKGDPITASVTGPYTRIQAPAGYLTASFSADVKDAVAGHIRAGDYIDVATVTAPTDGSSPVGEFALQTVLVLDVSVSPEKIANAANDNGDTPSVGPDSGAVYNGFPDYYTVAVTPDQFLTLARIKASTLFVGLSPVDQAKAARDAAASGTPTPASGTDNAAPSASPSSAAPSQTTNSGNQSEVQPSGNPSSSAPAVQGTDTNNTTK